MDDSETYVSHFLQELNCHQYLDSFKNWNLTSQDALAHIDKEILVEVGVKKIGDRIRILKKCQSLRGSRTRPSHEVRELLQKFQALSVAQLTTTEELVTDKHSAIFILNDGSAKKVNVNGCFNADSIKKKLIKKLPSEFIACTPQGEETRNSQDYDVFVVDYVKNVLHLLYDVELVTICHSVDRVEKNRLIFVSKDQTPSDRATLTSKKLYLKTLSVIHQLGSLSALAGTTSSARAKIHAVNELAAPGTAAGAPNSLRIENNKDTIRQIFNQRPPSELISTNLSEYFPHTDAKSLRKTIGNSVRQSIRLSSINGSATPVGGNNVGDIWVNNSNAVGKALLQSLDGNHHVPTGSSLSKRRTQIEEDTLNFKAPESAHGESEVSKNSEGTTERRTGPTKRPGLISHAEYLRQGPRKQKSSERIELLRVADSDNDEEDEDMISLPTKIATPKNWLKGARIGAGSFGSVYLGMNAQTGELMAVKQVELQPTAVTAGVVSVSDEIKKQYNQNANASAVKNSSQVHRKMIDALQHEMGLLKELHHENIVTYYGSSQEGGNLNIFLEYVPGGSVSSMLNSYGPFEEPLIKNFTRQILIGLSYLHRKNIIHRDIKGANILIDIKGCVKITDFGISKKLSPLNQQQNKRASLQGSVYWMAPEVVKQVVTTKKADIWSVGCVIIEMFTGKHPFPDFSQMQAIFKIGTNTHPESPSWASDEAKNFLLKAFELDYRQRPDSIELLQHAWLDTSIM
ncbi:mitogen-activated protein kinase kinase kinase STE11 [Lachancea thermotolerans CBS 6340]|uniref:Serine/threonine-protein kinase STE11 n=1 Tax=Lachancea thermotolerans (strain ATCC 56472 / CBS 6340 / NRRL Y-8284) TaxID=559295 RepID=C5DHH3_LACTC|nr:KLTH0E04334p [Lachancea thermotolerans CBS 6340]CAR23234.1 KLTH0E04334p [Lachancea thermotolerans CBS 6340]